MFNVSMKLGSKVTFPIVAGWTVTTADPTVIGVTPTGTTTTVTLAALKPGQTTVKVAPAGDLLVELQVGVTAT